VTPAERMAEFERLSLIELDLYLEQRVLYRQLVAEGGQRGVRPPAKPRFRQAPAVGSPGVGPGRSPKFDERQCGVDFLWPIGVIPLTG